MWLYITGHVTYILLTEVHFTKTIIVCSIKNIIISCNIINYLLDLLFISLDHDIVFIDACFIVGSDDLSRVAIYNQCNTIFQICIKYNILLQSWGVQNVTTY